MQRSESIGKLTMALCKVQGEIEHAHKNATNPHFKNRYADLTQVIDAVRPVLAKHGLMVIQFPGYADGVTTLETVIAHESGEWMSGTAGARVQKDDPQGVGSAITYLRRYSLAAACGIGQDDDDGEGAVQQRGREPAPKPEPKTKATGPTGTPFTFALGNVAPGDGAKGRTWENLLTDENGRAYIQWAVGNMTRLDDGARKMLLQAMLDQAAEAGAIDVPQAARIEGVISGGAQDKMAAAAKWLNEQVSKKQPA